MVWLDIVVVLCYFESEHFQKVTAHLMKEKHVGQFYSYLSSAVERRCKEVQLEEGTTSDSRPEKNTADNSQSKGSEDITTLSAEGKIMLPDFLSFS